MLNKFNLEKISERFEISLTGVGYTNHLSLVTALRESGLCNLVTLAHVKKGYIVTIDISCQSENTSVVTRASIIDIILSHT